MIKKLVIICLLFPYVSSGQIDPTALQKWKDLKYSLFIHFGIYAQLGGVWEGKAISRGLSEQIQAHAGIYSDVYEDVAKQFNPVKWNPDSIALLAKSAGMGSVIITSKHHDGFAMYNSAYTDFDIVDATPYKRDIIAELSQACQRHGLKFGLYFSLIDWHYPQASPISSHNSDLITSEHHQYNMNQIAELLTNYGAISELWFDMGSMTADQSKEMRALVRRLQPNCMIGSRIGNDQGDFTVMGDNQEPNYIIGVPWQSPASFFDETWGYRSWQKRTDPDEKMREKLTSLISVISRGGNYLLNIGPTGDGSVVDYEREILVKMGDWLRKNGSAIYGTKTDPFQTSFSWGCVTSAPSKLNLVVIKNPNDGMIRLPGLKGKVKKIHILHDKTPLNVKRISNDLVIYLPSGFDVSEEFKVIALEFVDGYSVSPASIIDGDQQRIVLSHHNSFKYFSNSGIDYSTRYTSTIKEEWTLQASKEIVVNPEVYYSQEEKGKLLELNFNGSAQVLRLMDGEEIELANPGSSLSLGSMYLQGPFNSGIEGVHDSVSAIDISKPWSTSNEWQAKDEWRNGILYTLPADREEAYYVLQEIQLAEQKKVLVEIVSGDGLAVWLNGVQKYIQINSAKSDSITHHVVLDLKSGKNQLLVKLFNNFHKQIYFKIRFPDAHRVYRKVLSAITLKKDKLYSISWQLNNPTSPHQDMNIPNVELVLTRQQ